MSREQWISSQPWTYTRGQIEAIRPARTALEAARAFDAAVIHGALQVVSEQRTLYRWRVAFEHAVFDRAFMDRTSFDRTFDFHAMFANNAQRAAEYRLANLSGTAPYWKRT